MKKITKRVIGRIVFWGIVIAAPIVFFYMVHIYLNAYLTEERVLWVMIPVFELISDRTARIESTDAYFGFNSTFEFRNIRFYPKTAPDATENTHPDASIERLLVRFKTLTLLGGRFEVDSLLIEGFRGTLKYDPDRSYSHYVWIDPDESRRMEINITSSDINNIHIKSFHINNANVRYVNDGLGIEYHIDDFYQELEIEGFRVMNIFLINGTVGGIFMNPGTDEPYTDIMLSGRLQINIDDGTFIVREGRMTIGEDEFSYSAFVTGEGDDAHIAVIFQEPRDPVREALMKLPPSMIQWLEGDLEGSGYRVQVNYRDDQT
jgi:hypothetical protein